VIYELHNCGVLKTHGSEAAPTTAEATTADLNWGPENDTPQKLAPYKIQPRRSTLRESTTLGVFAGDASIPANQCTHTAIRHTYYSGDYSPN